MSCQVHVKAIHNLDATGAITGSTYYDMRTSPPTLLTQAAYDALDKVRCPEYSSDNENVCLQPTGNTDPTLIVEGFKCVNKATTFDTAGVAAVAITGITLHDMLGVDLTATHEIVPCPETITIESDHCVA